ETVAMAKARISAKWPSSMLIQQSPAHRSPHGCRSRFPSPLAGEGASRSEAGEGAMWNNRNPSSGSAAPSHLLPQGEKGHRLQPLCAGTSLRRAFALPLAALLEGLDHLLWHVILVVLGEHARRREVAVGRDRTF